MKFISEFVKQWASCALVPVTAVVCGLAVPDAHGAATLVPTGAVWKYLDNGSNQGTAWRAAAFSDSPWASGSAQLGYGDGDEATVVNYGPSATSKYITTYFRRSFNVADASAFTALTLRLLRDDGAVVYLNGAEVFRSNMPGGTIGFTTLASSALGAPAESTFIETSISPTSLANGVNVVAVEIHQANGTSSDVSFDLELTGSNASTATVTRGPYLQMSTPTSMMVRWRTDAPGNSRVRYGTDPANLTLTADNLVSTTEHSVTLTGLSPDTGYYYSVGTTTATIAGGADYVFYTPPLPGAALPTRIWVIGDSGTADANAAAVRDAYYQFSGTRYTDLWLMLGDNAYNSGLDNEYQAAVFNMYPDILRQTVLWPTIGNHDTAGSSNPADTIAYYSIFTLPRNGEAGGVASGTEDYYSFDFGNIHFVCLDSMTSDRSANGPMLAWLRNDLSANLRDWTIAFWHHPPYSKGSHDSDVDVELVQMRQNALPILEDYGVDLVLSGHSHSYERSYLLDGHYGTSGTLTTAMIKDAGSGREESGGAYEKPAGAASHQGTVYVVAGSSAKISGGLLNHPAMFLSLNRLGSMVLDINGNRLDAKFITDTGATSDYFSLVKDSPSPPPAPGNLAASAVSNDRIDLAWTDNSTDESGFKIEQSTDGVNFNQIATVGANVTGYSSTGLSPTTTYSYRVRAFNAAGDSAYSNVATATTAAPLAAPTGLTATPVSKSQINLNWTDNADDEVGFRIERSTDGTSFTQIGTVGPNVTTFASTGLQRNRRYYYRVRATDNFGDSAYSNIATARTLKN
jgi:calcineurin-like phosphoesterase family protein/purple acid phosphatase-like protein/fibronectin type III domain protein